MSDFQAGFELGQRVAAIERRLDDLQLREYVEPAEYMDSVGQLQAALAEMRDAQQIAAVAEVEAAIEHDPEAEEAAEEIEEVIEEAAEEIEEAIEEVVLNEIEEDTMEPERTHFLDKRVGGE